MAKSSNEIEREKELERVKTLKKRQLGKRLMQMIVVLLGISFITYGLVYLAPGDPVRVMYAASGQMPDEAQLNQTREALGLNQPFLIQYGNWLKGVLTGDFGISYSMQKPVAQILLLRLWPTVKLTLTALAFMLFVSIPLGILAAVRKDKFWDYLIRGATFFGMAMPGFWVGLLLLYYVAYQWKLVPVIATGTSMEAVFLPALTLAFSMTAKYTRQVRAAVVEELGKDYIIGARARGIREWKILWCHVMPNAFLPLITLLGISLGSLLGGTAVVEVIFSYPGLGSLVVSAVTAYDYPLVQAYVLWIASIYMVISFVVDVSYTLVDPRIPKA